MALKNIKYTLRTKTEVPKVMEMDIENILINIQKRPTLLIDNIIVNYERLGGFQYYYNETLKSDKKFAINTNEIVSIRYFDSERKTYNVISSKKRWHRIIEDVEIHISTKSTPLIKIRMSNGDVYDVKDYQIDEQIHKYRGKQ